MKDHPDISTSYLFCSPADDAAAWRLSLDRFADSLTRAFPGVFTRRRTTGFRGGSVLEFEVALEGGLRARGIVAVPVAECGAVTVVDASCEAAALFAHWLRDSFARLRT
ncbi:hypothetical protein GCM10010406_54330 [Streptomyces thermolineatus]|uniref:Uncharacterized protein n=1 Tax=Streptomyces thermolineatus TaxID=44033 RepID=A0ABP6ACN8_9ACTN